LPEATASNDVECADALASGEVLNVEAAFGQFADARSEALSRNAETGEVARPGRNDHKILSALRDCRRRQRACRNGGRTCGERGILQK
jgi:hypothetical protein